MKHIEAIGKLSKLLQAEEDFIKKMDEAIFAMNSVCMFPDSTDEQWALREAFVKAQSSVRRHYELLKESVENIIESN